MLFLKRLCSCSSIASLSLSQFHLYSTQSSHRFIIYSLSKLKFQNILFGPQYEIIYHLPSFSTITQGTVLVHAKDIGKLSLDLENAIEEHRYNDIWDLQDQHMRIDGFPRKYIVNRMICVLSESRDTQWLEKAYGLVEQAFVESKHNLFDKETLVYLSFSLARCGLPVQASTVLRKLVDMELFPHVNVWSAILGYLSKTGLGAFLAAELVLEIGFLFQDGRVDPRKKINAPLIAMKPNTAAFNIALAGCLLFDTTRKAEQLLEMMPRIGVKADVTLLIIMARIYEKNGRREELKKLKRYVDEAHSISETQFREFYTCLLTCHLNFGDLESASHMVLEMLRKAKQARNSLAGTNFSLEATEFRKVVPDKKLEELSYGGLHQSHSISFEDFSRDRNFSNLEPMTKDLLRYLLLKLQGEKELITSERGILQPTEMIFVKLVKAFLEAGKTKELAEFLIKAEREDSPSSVDDSALVQVINSCITLGWLDQAHDLLDEMRLAGVKSGSSLYASLLKAYIKENRFAEVSSLLRDARKAGVQLDSSSYEALIKTRVLQKDTEGALDLFKEMKEAKLPRTGHNFEILVKGCEENGEAGMMSKLLREIKEGQKVDSGVQDWNNVIHFFSKKRLMQDAEKALKKMRSLGHIPNAQTFHSMVTGYAAIGGKYTEVTELWGEMKSLSCTNPMKFDQELLDSVLYTFVRGGFFFRANEVVEMMEKGDMFVDKYKYRTLFLKYHKTLCKGKAPKVQTEAQLKKRESAIAFKKWIGLC